MRLDEEETSEELDAELGEEARMLRETSLAPVYGYSPKGGRLKRSIPRKQGKNTTLLASMSVEGMGPSMVVHGSTTVGVFEAYLEHVLLAELAEGRVVVMDSLPAHKPKRVRDPIQRRGCELLYFPGYSPDYDPIEEVFSKIKQVLRGAAARTRGALVEAIGRALCAVSPQDARSFFGHDGYRSTGQYCETCCRAPRSRVAGINIQASHSPPHNLAFSRRL